MTTTPEITKVVRNGTTNVLERRIRPFGETDVTLVRADGDETDPKFTGHAAVFNSRTAIGNPMRWGWYEQIAPGAFTKTLSEGDARFLVDHDSRMLVARVSAGDLRLSEDEVGLATDADLDVELSYVKDLVRNLDKKRITGMSFGFFVVRDKWETEQVETSNGDPIDVEVRTILEVRLLEVSAVTFPAYDETDAGLRKVCDEIRSLRDQDDDPETSSPAQREDSAPPEEGTRSEGEDAPPEEGTRPRLRMAKVRMDLLSHRLPDHPAGQSSPTDPNGSEGAGS